MTAQSKGSAAPAVRTADIAIVGGGIAGSVAATLLGRQGYRVALMDIHPVYPPDFRCEKVAFEQIELLRAIDMFDCVSKISTRVSEMAVVRNGRMVERKASAEYGLFYENMVNAVRDQLPASVELIVGKVLDLKTSAERQQVILSGGEVVDTRLIVLASGLGDVLRQKLGITRRTIRNGHSLTIGFSLLPAPGQAFDFPALTYYGERAGDGMGYISIFPIGDVFRTNLFCYRGYDGAWAKGFRDAPHETLYAAMPSLRKYLGDFQMVSKVKLRMVDLMEVGNVRQNGVVLIGDSFRTTCPGAGNGVTRALTDATQLCKVHVPHWLATAGMGADKIAQFYDDPVKQACDIHCAEAAEYHRSFSVERGLMWRARRWRAFLRPLANRWIRSEPDNRGRFGEFRSAGPQLAVPARRVSPIVPR
jgi:2-polyprenyl-6-methoxyphenol hydroxylase-like FAD-dependent oxidoreductase